jgi:predicted alpha-1,2-mannosidase
VILEVGGGPVGGPTSADGVGFRSPDATRYSGNTSDRSPLDIAGGRLLASGDRLRYQIYPELDEGLNYVATYAAVDLVFTDGSLLSELGLRDQYGMGFSAAGQGAAKILYADQWNDVQVDLSPAAGKIIDQVVLAVELPDSLDGNEFKGWLDGVQIDKAPADPDGSDRCAYVDTRRGTNASGAFSRGNNLPITAWPNGFNFFTPVTDATTHRWPYEYHRANNADNLTELQGLSFSHQPSPWMGDRNQLSIMPVADAEPLGDPKARAAAFSHDDELARPDHYRVALTTGVTAELAPTDHGVIMRFAFPATAQGRHLIIDTIDDHGGFSFDGEALTGWVENGSEFGRTRMFCYGRFDSAPTAFGPSAGGRGNTRAASFDTDEVVLRIASSLISTDQARHNFDLELGTRSLADVRQEANRAWNDRLDAISVEGASQPQLRTLYGSLYRLNLYPNSGFENLGSADQPDHRYASPVEVTDGLPTSTTTNAKINKGKIYVNNGFWDTYRTAWPAYALIYPTLAAELVDGFVEQYRAGGWVARWSSPGYADLMTGTSSDVAFADAYVKGVPLPDPLGSYDAALKNATVTPTDRAVGRKGIARGLFLGYTSTEVEESVSWALEGFLNDFGIAEMAAVLAEDPATPDQRRGQLLEESEYFRRRSLNYLLLFDDNIDFFQGRRQDGTFAKTPEEFDPGEWGGDFTETDGWNFAFHVAHDGAGLASLYGGPKGLAAKLDEFFATPERADKPGTYGRAIHEMDEARAVRMGQFGFSNQPAHHIPYIYNYTGQPHRTQEIVREVLQRLFTGEQTGQGYPGDEDNGEMSAWYLFSALGIYPLRVGSQEYAIGSPLFDQAEVSRDDGSKITITAKNQAHDHPYVQQVQLNGRDVPDLSIDHQDLVGGTLEFVLGKEPVSRHPELVEGPRPVPLLDLTGPGRGSTDPVFAALFDNDAETEFTLAGDQRSIAWTFDEAVRPTLYTVTSGNDDDHPTGWRLEGSSDGVAWSVLDERHDQSFRWQRQTRPFCITSPAECTQVRLVFDGADQVTVSELEFLA